MSLRFRLSSLVCVVLVLSLALGGLVAYGNAVRSVRTEMRAALLVGRQTIETGIERLHSSADPARDLDQLIASFEGNRHLRVWLGGAKPVVAAPVAERPQFGSVPAWFERVIGVTPETDRIPVVIGGSDLGVVRVETEPYNEILEVWNDFTDSLITPAVFCVLTVLVIYLFIGRILRPLEQLGAALEEVGDGRYRTRISGRLPPELSRLRDSFNRMVARLAAADADNRRLNEQLLTLQEQERGDLARDLHDEVSPFLFAVGTDAASAARLLADGRNAEADEHIRSIADAVSHIQRQVRRMLGRLRPVGLDDLGLAAAIENLVAFWRRRRPQIRYEVVVAAECEGLSDMIGTTICRVVQEALANAVRHAEAEVVAITVEPRRDVTDGRDEISVRIADDGRGMGEEARMGYGLTGLGERIAALGGRLTFSNRPDRGFAVLAALPHRQQPETVALRGPEAGS
ncbi:MAG TPA: histidine kinase [Stellaceae bacterium]|jgi:two-component system sensor histidine kinase UhpB